MDGKKGVYVNSLKNDLAIYNVAIAVITEVKLNDIRREKKSTPPSPYDGYVHSM